LTTIPGTVPNPARFPGGCKFHPRCPHTRKLAESAPAGATSEIKSGDQMVRILARCKNEEPELREIHKRHWAACHQIAGYDQSVVTLPVLQHKREVTASADESGATLIEAVKGTTA
jgi:hypothetical protein